MPKHWHPLPGLYQDNGQSWSLQEQMLANKAVEKGMDELISFYQNNVTKSPIKKLRHDAVNSLIDDAY